MGHSKNLRLFKSPKLGHFIQKVEQDRNRAGDRQQKGLAQNAKRKEYDNQLRQKNRAQQKQQQPSQGGRNHKQSEPMDYHEYQKMLREQSLQSMQNSHTDQNRIEDSRDAIDKGTAGSGFAPGTLPPSSRGSHGPC